jgi:hypothetical protein
MCVAALIIGTQYVIHEALQFVQWRDEEHGQTRCNDACFPERYMARHSDGRCACTDGVVRP